MIHACGWCCSITGINLKIGTDKLTHGLCRDCQPKFYRKAGMSEEEIKEAMNERASNDIEKAS